MKQSAYRIHGMDCAEEVKALRTEFGGQPGVQDLAFDLLNAKLTVTHDAAVFGEREIRGAVARAGMKAEPWSDTRGSEKKSRFAEARTILTAASGALLVAGYLGHAAAAGWLAALGAREGEAVPIVARCVYFAAIVAGAWFVFPKALMSARRFRADMNLLMMIAVAGAMGLGEWLEAASVSFLFAVSLLLESWSVSRARNAVTALMEIAPPKARIRCSRSNCEQLVDVAGVEVGTCFFIRPGEKFPLDGIIIAGHTSANEAPITGESSPVEKQPGDEVFAGTINGDGAIEARVTKAASDTMLARIIRLVSEAQSRRSPSEQWVERFARIYTPAVLALAVGVALVPPLLLGKPWGDWFYQALVLLVIACPCALVISTPVSVVAALASAARNGVLIKGGQSLEMPGRLRAIAFDKTGTLTVGHPVVAKIAAFAEHSEEAVLGLAATLESQSNHPIARAIVAEANRRGLGLRGLANSQNAQGRGTTGSVDGISYWIGSHRFMAERGLETEELQAHIARLSGSGESVVAIGTEDRVIGIIALADQLRPQATGAIAQLHRRNVKVSVLTGDNQRTADALARTAGIDDVRAELLPADKLAAIEELLDRHTYVAMVGDGVNDAPALARSSLGIAMGAAGTDAALETADVALMSDDLTRIPWLVEHSRRTLRVIRQNIILALGIKALFVLLTLYGAASLWAAIAADMGVSFLVVLNALRLLDAASD